MDFLPREDCKSPYAFMRVYPCNCSHAAVGEEDRTEIVTLKVDITKQLPRDVPTSFSRSTDIDAFSCLGRFTVLVTKIENDAHRIVVDVSHHAIL